MDFQGTDYYDYLVRLSNNEFMRLVWKMDMGELQKLADYLIKNNADQERIDLVLDEIDPERNTSYEEACNEAEARMLEEKYESDRERGASGDY